MKKVCKSLLTGLAVAAMALMFGGAIARCQSAQAVDILPAEDLKGWTRIPWMPNEALSPKMQWRVDPAQHALVCSGDGGHEWLRYDRELGDFILEADWRFTPRTPGEKAYNSGVGVRLSKAAEIWCQAQTGLTGGFLFGSNLVDGVFKRFNLRADMKENRIKPPGEWNHYEIRAQGDKIALSVNGQVVSEVSGYALRRGYIALEAEGFEVTFRNLKLKVLE